ncbi:unnamed protein product [Calypogeia fissa]
MRNGGSSIRGPLGVLCECTAGRLPGSGEQQVQHTPVNGGEWGAGVGVRSQSNPAKGRLWLEQRVELVQGSSKKIINLNL